MPRYAASWRACAPSENGTTNSYAGRDHGTDPFEPKGHTDVLRRHADDGTADLQGVGRAGRHRHSRPVRQERQVHLRPGLPVDRLV
jgi:hypothetical protein